MDMRFNVNCNVRVKFFELGLKRHRALWDDLAKRIPGFGERYPYAPPAVDAEGYHRGQLWSLMKDYGDLCRLGGDPPFETEIILEFEGK